MCRGLHDLGYTFDLECGRCCGSALSISAQPALNLCSAFTCARAIGVRPQRFSLHIEQCEQ